MTGVPASAATNRRSVDRPRTHMTAGSTTTTEGSTSRAMVTARAWLSALPTTSISASSSSPAITPSRLRGESSTTRTRMAPAGRIGHPATGPPTAGPRALSARAQARLLVSDTAIFSRPFDTVLPAGACNRFIRQRRMRAGLRSEWSSRHQDVLRRPARRRKAAARRQLDHRAAARLRAGAPLRRAGASGGAEALTRREEDLLRLLRRGHTQAEIASELRVSGARCRSTSPASARRPASRAAATCSGGRPSWAFSERRRLCRAPALCETHPPARSPLAL